MERLSFSWERLETRERLLVTSLIFVFLPVALYFLVADPLLEARETADRQRAEALALNRWVAQRHADWQAEGAVAEEPRTSQGPVGLVGLERALSEGGMRAAVSQLENNRDGRITLTLDGVAFTEFARFIERMEPEFGYQISSMNITASAKPGEIVVRLALQP